MAADISVSIGVDGESKFKTALRECQNSVKQIDSALKANAAEWESNADAMGENVERTKLLRAQLETQQNIMRGLGEAIEYASDQYGENSKAATDYIIAQNKAREAVAKLEKELKDADREAEELGRDSVKVGQQIEKGIGDGAQDAAKDLEGINDLLDGLEDIKGMMSLSVGMDLVGNIVEGVGEIVEGTEEFRRTFGYLEQNAKDAGISMETVGKNLAYATGVTGEYEEAVEGLSNLLGAKLDAKELTDAMNLLLGAAIKMPDTWKFESLAEGLRETLTEKKAVGQFADLLSYLNVDLETFNKAMEKTGTLESAQDVLMGFIANRGLEDTLRSWESDNQEMIEQATASLELQKSMADLAVEMQGMATAWTTLQAITAQTVTNLLQDTQVDEWITDKIEKVTEVIRLLGTAEGRAELLAQATAGMGETISHEDVAPDAATELANIEKAIAEARMTGDSVLLMGLEMRAEELKAAKEAGTQIGEAVVEAEEEALQDEEETLKKEIEKQMVDLSDQFGESTPGVTAAAAGLAAAITDAINNGVVLPDIWGWVNDTMQALKTRPTTYQYQPGSGSRTPLENKTYQISMSVNGRNFANAIVNDMDIAQGRVVALG